MNQKVVQSAAVLLLLSILVNIHGCESRTVKPEDVLVSETVCTTVGTSAIVTSRAITSGVTSYTSNSTTEEQTTVTEPYSVISESVAETKVPVTEEPVLIEVPVEVVIVQEPVQEVITDAPVSEEPEVTEVSLTADKDSMIYVKRFPRGTYYPAGPNAKGGSTRYLIDCSIGDETVKGSVASSYLYTHYGYEYNRSRTLLYLEVYDKEGIRDLSEMNGYYYLDDSDAWNPNVIDFYYAYEESCPFQGIGVVDVECWVVP